MRVLVVAVLVLALIQVAVPAQASQTCWDGICWEDPPPPPKPDPHCNGSCIPGLHPTGHISGVVANTQGGPIQGATVYWQYGETTTNYAGAYTITVWADQALTLTADHPKYFWQSAAIPNPIVASATGQNFRLPYLITATTSPSAFNASVSRTLTVHAYSTAPTSGVRVVMSDQSQTLSDLAYDGTYTSPDGWSRWTGSLFVAAGTPDGAYSLKFCVLQVGATGNCDPSNPLLLSQVRTITYKVDSVAPVITTSFPKRYGDLMQLSAISVTWLDPLSGVDSSSLTMSLDGVARSTSSSGGTVSASAAGVLPGIHRVFVQARDLAGNSASDSFLFTLVTASPNGGQATLAEQTVAVNPNGAIPPPSTVRFSSPPVSFSSFSETINASARVGHGVFRRNFNLGSLEVVFRNTAGLTSSVFVTAPLGTESHRVAVLSPSGSSSTTKIPAHNGTIADIVVQVPTGFNTIGSTATLLAKTAELGTATVESNHVLDSQLPARTPVFGSISACFADDGSGTIVECRADPSGGITYVQVAGVEIPVLIPSVVAPPPDTSADDGQVQQCIGSACLASAPIRPGELAALAISCPALATIDQNLPAINLCSNVPGAPTRSAWTGYLNAWIYKEGPASDPRFPVWQQNHADSPGPAEEPACPNGAAGTFKGITYRLIANTTANDNANTATIGGTWADSTNLSDEFVYLGTKKGNDRDFRTDEAIGFQLSNDPSLGNKAVPLTVHPIEGSYLAADPSAYIDERGQRRVSGSSTTNGWQQGTDAVVSPAATISRIERLQIMTGTEFTHPSNSGTYDITTTLAFQLLLDTSSCGPQP